MRFGRFEWDDEKATSNSEKHGISFEEAITVFDDPRARIAEDPKHSSGETRFWAIGATAFSAQIVVVAFTDRAGLVRVISARPASRRERRGYESS